MTQIIKATKRDLQGTGASRRLRRSGYTPAVIYGDNQEPISISVKHNVVYYAVQKENFHTNVLKVDVDGQVYDVIVRAFQMHPYKPLLQHLDFQIVNLNKPIRIKVPVRLVNGEVSPAVKLQGGRISQLAQTVELLVLPSQIPDSIELDLGNITGGQILHLSDLVLPEGAVSVVAKRGENPPVATASGKNK